MEPKSIELLKNLFDKCNGDNNSSDSEDEGDPINKFGPGDIKPKKAEVKNTLENPLLKKISKNDENPKTLEEWEEMQKNDEEILDTRISPEYKISYKQAVTTEDIYLQMGLKTPSTASCEDMIIDIDLPDETVGIDRMDLDVMEESLDLKTPVYRLKLNLPHKVATAKSRAQFDTDKKILKLTLRMNREFDFVNF
jgi:hypothetical protein